MAKQCVFCGNPHLKITDRYQWCDNCHSGRFFGACPVCGGDLDASLDPLAECRECDRRWGEPKAVVIDIADYLAGNVQVPPPGLQSLEQLLQWLERLEE